MSAQIMDLVAQVVALNPTYTMHVTGHSLGGSVAMFASLAIQHAYPDLHVNHMTYGEPRVGNGTVRAMHRQY